MQKRWKLLPTNNEATDLLYQSLKINKTICSILVNRGITNFESSKIFFRPQLSMLHSPWLMKDMDKAVNRMIEAINNNENILVFGDYDVDGTTSVAGMYQFLQQLSNKVDYYIPHRYKEGYGISKMGIDYAKENHQTLIISLDCGIKSVDLVDYATSLGIDFIICDHHLPDDVLPKAVAILNAKQPNCNYPYKELCGCGVGFKLMQAIAEKLQLPDDSFLQYLDLVAIAIAADIVPITGENRVLAFYGLQRINTNPCTGVKALMQLAGAQKIMYITNLVFIIAPRVNAAGRMDDAKNAVLLFIEKDLYKALEFSEKLHSDNSERKEADSTTTQEALAIIEQDIHFNKKNTTVVYQEHWHKGVVGIVASRLIETYYRPTIVLTKSGDIVAGSARSIAGFNVYHAIDACKDHLIGYGGHFAAAGMTLMKENIESFATAFEKVVSDTITPELLVPEIIIDAEIVLKDINLAFYNIISQMEPFGPENLRPVFIARRLTDTGFSKIVKEQHLRFSVQQNNIQISGIGFGLANKFSLLQNKQLIDLVFTINLNEYNGQQNVQLQVLDVKLSV